MSDYARANTGGSTHFGDKDALTTGDADKVIVGAQFDSEFNALVTAVATKYDSADIASTAQAQTPTSDAVIMTPLKVEEWSQAQGGMVYDIQQLADPNADQLLGWDDDSGGTGAVIGFTLGTGLTFSTTTVALSHLGLEALTDPGADRILFWDDVGAGALTWLTVGTNLDLTGTTLSAPTATLEAAINHDNLTGFVANEHLDWTGDQGASNIHVNNITAVPEAAVTAHEAALTITESQISDMPVTVSQAVAEAGTDTTDTLWTAQRVAQAIAALESKGNVNGCKVHDASTQSIANSSWDVVAWDTEAYDTNGFHDTVTNNSRITIPSGTTRVRLTALISWDDNGSSVRKIKIRKNGSDGAIDDAVVTYQPQVTMTAALDDNIPYGQFIDSGIITVAATDYFEVLVYQTSGAALNIEAYQSWFQCEELA